MSPTNRAQPSLSSQSSLSQGSQQPEPTGPGNRGHSNGRPSLSSSESHSGDSDGSKSPTPRSRNVADAATAERGTSPMEPPMEYIVVLDAPSPHPHRPPIPHRFCGFCRFCVMHVAKWISLVEIYFAYMLIPRQKWTFYVKHFLLGKAMEYYNSQFGHADHPWSQFASAFIFHFLNIHDASV